MSNLTFVVTDNIATWSKIGIAAFAVGGEPSEIRWPSGDLNRYAVSCESPSYSAVAEQIKSSVSNLNFSSFAERISKFYASLSEGQEPLGAEFESVWDANVDELYES